MSSDVYVPVYEGFDAFHWPAPPVFAPKNTDLLLSMEESKRCHFCSTPLQLYPELSDEPREGDNAPQYVYICPLCGFWYGRGTRGYAEGPAWQRGVMGRIRKFPLSSLEIPVPDLVRFLNSNEHLLNKINPFKAEELVSHILSDALSCEVRHLGGRRDGGVDAYAVLNDNTQALVQIKWRQDGAGAEGVKVIREIAGTLMARGIPRGILVSTAPRVSRDAQNEIALLNTREISGLGQIQLEYKVYADVLSMLQVSTRKLSHTPTINLGDDLDRYTLFD